MIAVKSGWFHLIGLFFVLLSLSPAFGESEIQLARYYDCARASSYIANRLTVQARVDGKTLTPEYKTQDYLRGLDIKLVLSDSGQINRIKIGDKIVLSLEQMQKGIEFGVGMLTAAHTVQIKQFDSKTGGVLEFGFLKNFFATERSVRITEKSNLNEFYQEKYGPSWGKFTLAVKKNAFSNQWELQDHSGKTLDNIYGIMDMNFLMIATGIIDMVGTQKQSACMKSEYTNRLRKVVKVSTKNKEYPCDIGPRAGQASTEFGWHLLAPVLPQ